ncbi:hypothetical protein, partial [Haloferula sp. A504]|uniref:hypothetical protein n=1 Tax=Haloferula sp. A504 TaxID=3373601 RepID=UPI0031CBEA7F|nr:hypothetical protein [Verrucomicrobiaceae bacterium E54]
TFSVRADGLDVTEYFDLLFSSIDGARTGIERWSADEDAEVSLELRNGLVFGEEVSDAGRVVGKAGFEGHVVDGRLNLPGVYLVLNARPQDDAEAVTMEVLFKGKTLERRELPGGWDGRISVDDRYLSELGDQWPPRDLSFRFTKLGYKPLDLTWEEASTGEFPGFKEAKAEMVIRWEGSTFGTGYSCSALRILDALGKPVTSVEASISEPQSMLLGEGSFTLQLMGEPWSADGLAGETGSENREDPVPIAACTLEVTSEAVEQDQPISLGVPLTIPSLRVEFPDQWVDFAELVIRRSDTPAASTPIIGGDPYQLSLDHFWLLDSRGSRLSSITLPLDSIGATVSVDRRERKAAKELSVPLTGGEYEYIFEGTTLPPTVSRDDAKGSFKVDPAVGVSLKAPTPYGGVFHGEIRAPSVGEYERPKEPGDVEKSWWWKEEGLMLDFFHPACVSDDAYEAQVEKKAKNRKLYGSFRMDYRRGATSAMFTMFSLGTKRYWFWWRMKHLGIDEETGEAIWSLVEQISGVEQPSGSFNADPKEGGTLDFSGM